ncbi:MAG: hypothetical protein JW719_04070, partial [Pirellulales bacterium]|nr:hypothetical protein [Pirellulales bacterium]
GMTLIKSEADQPAVHCRRAGAHVGKSIAKCFTLSVIVDALGLVALETRQTPVFPKGEPT